MFKLLFLDFELASELDLNLVGTDNYLKHPSTRILMGSYIIDNTEVKLWEPHKHPEIPEDLAEALNNPEYLIIGWNVGGMERNAIRQFLHLNLPISRYLDLMIVCRHLSLPGKLKPVSKILKLGDEGKLEGDKFINLFCIPAHKGGELTLFGLSEPRWNNWDTHPVEWSEFGEYCKHDTISCQKIYKMMKHHPLPQSEIEGWWLDQKINDAGMPVDIELVQKMDKIAERAKREAADNIKRLSGVENPNSREQLLKWLKTQNYPYGSLQKPFVTASLDDIGMTQEAASVLEFRREAAKTSDAKLEAMKNSISDDGFVKDMFGYLGAARTGRWNSYGVQFTNQPRITKEVEKKHDRAIELILAEDYDSLKKEFSSVMDVISGCIRSCFCAPEDYEFVIADESAVEHRVVGWVSGCDSILEIHRQGKDPYLAFAEWLFGIPYESMIYIDKNGKHKCKEEFKDIRQLSKPPVLGCGFQLSGGEESVNEDGDEIRTGLFGYAKQQCNVDMPKELAHKAVGIYRERHSEVKDFWWNIEEAAIAAIKNRKTVKLRSLELDVLGKTFRIKLPSGRYLHYINPRVEKRESKWGVKDTILFDGFSSTSKNKSWMEQQTYGGRLTENVVQAIARDILLEALKLSDKIGFRLVGHCHDEIIALKHKNSELGLEKLIECMSKSPVWAKNIPLGADGFISKRYRKG
jgi:DNA polymerase